MCSPVTPGAVAPLSAAVPSACTPDVLPAVPIDLNSAHRDLEANIDAEPQPKTHRPRVGRRQIGTTQHDMSGFWLWSCTLTFKLKTVLEYPHKNLLIDTHDGYVAAQWVRANFP